MEAAIARKMNDYLFEVGAFVLQAEEKIVRVEGRYSVVVTGAFEAVE